MKILTFFKSRTKQHSKMWRKKKKAGKFSLLLIAIIFSGSICAQERNTEQYMPVFGLKTNLLYWGTAATMNLGFEAGLGKKLRWMYQVIIILLPTMTVKN